MDCIQYCKLQFEGALERRRASRRLSILMALRVPKRRMSAPERRHRSGRPPSALVTEPQRQERATADKIATRLEEDIVLGRRHPRERLVEQDLCDRFNTHRADVRLALFELEKKGIVQRIPNAAQSCAISRQGKSWTFMRSVRN